MTVRDRHDADRPGLRRRAQLHFQATFAFDVTRAAIGPIGASEFPHLHEVVNAPGALDEFVRDLRALSRYSLYQALRELRARRTA